MQSMLNLKVKFRESFRPFAPSVLREHVCEWFELDQDSPYMLIVADVLESRRKPMTETEQNLFGIEKLNVPRSDIPAVTHVDYSARIQTVHKDTNPRYHALIQRFNQRTGCPVIVKRVLTSVASPSLALPRMLSAALWAPIWKCWLSAIVFCARKTRIQASRKTTSPPSSSIETLRCSA